MALWHNPFIITWIENVILSVCTSKITRGPNWSLLTFVTLSQLLAFGWGKPNLRIWTSEGFHTCQVLKNDYVENKLCFFGENWFDYMCFLGFETSIKCHKTSCSRTSSNLDPSWNMKICVHKSQVISPWPIHLHRVFLDAKLRPGFTQYATSRSPESRITSLDHPWRFRWNSAQKRLP